MDRKILVIVGNGFDLHANMKTSYNDFIEYLKNLRQRQYNAIVEHLPSGIEKGFLGATIKEKVLNFTNVNIWELLFLSCAAVKERKRELFNTPLVNWMDVESFMLSLTKDDPLSWKGILFYMDFANRNKVFPGTESLGLGSEHYLLPGLLASVFRSNGALQNELARFYKQSEPFEEFVEFLLRQLKDFEAIFGHFIEDRERYDQGGRKRRSFIEKMLGNNDMVNVYLDSFNYHEGWFDKRTRYINGNYQEPIFGIDESQLTGKEEWMPLSKSSRRLYFNDANYVGRRKFDIPDKVYVYGHSLGRQDYAYFFSLFDAMRLTDPTYTTKVEFHYSEYDPKRGVEIKNEYTKSVINLFTAYDRRNDIQAPLYTLAQLEVCGRIIVKKTD